MVKEIFINLPVKNLKNSIKFFSKLGFEFNPQFTDETATCMIVSDRINVMLLNQEKFSGFSPNPVCDANKSNEVLICLSVSSREKVNDLMNKALKAGGKKYNEAQDHGFMYGHGFQDLDGHVWELLYMEGAAG